jgi:hypothetical protein
MRRIRPAWFLFFFAPLTAEYVSGSSPYLNPFVWLANFLLYGAGALLIHELRTRQKKGWLAVFILAAAYMVAEEGLMLNTLFDPDKNTAGRALGVNWVWTAGMLMVHSLVSICAPLLLTEAVYDAEADRPWLSTPACFLLLAGFLANVFGLGRLIMPYHRPGLIYWLIEIAFIGLCILAACVVNGPGTRDSENRHAQTPIKVAFQTFAAMLATMLVGFVTPSINIPTLAKVIVMLAAYLGFLEWLRRCGIFSGDRMTRFAAACGMISFWVVFSPLKSVALHNPGPLIFGIFVAWLLARLSRQLRLPSGAVVA